MANSKLRFDLSDVVRAAIVIACLGATWWAFHDRDVLQHNLELSRQNEHVHRQVIEDDRHYISHAEMMDNAVLFSLDIRRAESEKYLEQRNSNWTRLVDACTELRLRGHDNHACSGIEK